MASGCFQCDWVIEGGVSLWELLSISNQLNLDMRTAPFKEDAAGFAILPLCVKVENADRMQLFLDRFGQKVGMVDWKPVSEETFLAGKPLATLPEAFKNEPQIILAWMRDIGDRGQKNLLQRQKIKGR